MNSVCNQLSLLPNAFTIACVASVSVGLSAGLKHFSLLERAKIGASAKNDEEGEGKGGQISPSPLLPSVLRSPQLLRRQNAKNASNGRKTLRKRLLRRLPLRWSGHNLIYIFKVTYYHLLPLKVLKSNIL